MRTSSNSAVEGSIVHSSSDNTEYKITECEMTGEGAFDYKRAVNYLEDRDYEYNSAFYF